MSAAAALESPAHEPARTARNLLERVLFTLREIPLAFDRDGVSQRLLRALADLYTVLDTGLDHRAHYDALDQSLQAIDEAGQMLAGSGDRSKFFALDAALNTLWQARTAVQNGSALAFPQLMDRRLELVGGDGASLAREDFRASIGLPALNSVPRPPVPLPIDIEPIVEIASTEVAPAAPKIKPPSSFEELSALADAAREGKLNPPEPDAPPAEGEPPPAPLFAYEPAVEEREALRDLARDALEDIASLSGLRKPIPTEGWLDQAPFEQRLLDNLDYFSSLGAPGFPLIALYHAEADAPDEARAFAVAFTFGSIQGADCVHAALTVVKQSPPEEMPGYVDGFALAANPVIDRELPALIEHPTPEIAAMAVSALARRGALTSASAELAFARNEPELTLKVTRALATNATAEYAIPQLEQRLHRPESDALFLAAAEALLVRGQSKTRDTLRSVLDWSGSGSPARLTGALWLLCLCGNNSDVERILAAAAQSPSAQVARGLGRYGHLQALPLLTQWLTAEDEALVESAAEALERISGAGLKRVVEEPWVKDLPPEAAQIPDLPNPMRKIEKVITDPAVWHDWQLREQPKLPPGLRYRAGRPFLPVFVADELEAAGTPIEQRQHAALELRLVTGIQTRFSPDDWVERQKQQLAEARKSIASLDDVAGTWWLGGFPAATLPVADRAAPRSVQAPLPAQAPSLEVALAASSGANDPGGLSLNDFAMLSAELELNPEGFRLAFSKYAVADQAAWEAIRDAWRKRINASRRLDTEWTRLHKAALDHWRTVFESGFGRR